MAHEATRRPARPATINVTVTFPVSNRGPFRDRRPEAETIGALRAAAMQHFVVAEDPQFVYYLTFRGVRAQDTATISQIVAPARAARFTLVKELVQG